MVSENPLEISPVLRHPNTMLRDFEKPSELVEGSQQCVDRITPSCRGTQSFTVHRCIRQGLGCTFGKPDSEWNVVGHRDKFAYKCSGIEGSIFAIRSFQSHLKNKRVLVASDNATVVSYLNKQWGTHSLEMCLMI